MSTYQMTSQGLDKLITERDQIKQKLAATQQKDRGGTTSWGGSFEKERLQNELYLLTERLREVEDLIAHAEVLTPSAGKDKKIGFGSRVTLLVNKEETVYTFVGAPEADPSQGHISIDSPIGTTLVGKKEGDVVRVDIPTGALQITVLEIM